MDYYGLQLILFLIITGLSLYLVHVHDLSLKYFLKHAKETQIQNNRDF